MLSWNFFFQYSAQYFSKALAAFPQNHCRNNGQRWEEWIMSQSLLSILGKNIGQARGSNQRPSVLKSPVWRSTELWGSELTLILGEKYNRLYCKFVVWERVQTKNETRELFKPSPQFWVPWERTSMKTLLDKEKRLFKPAFSPLPTIFSTPSNTNFNFSATFILSSANALNLDH